MVPAKPFDNCLRTITESDGIACVLMALKHFGIINTLDRGMEFELFHSHRAGSFDIVLPSALASIIGEYKNLKVTLSLGNDTIRNDKYYFPTDEFIGMFNEEENEYLRSRGAFDLVRNDKISSDSIIKSLDEGCVVLASTYMDTEDECSLSIPEYELRWVVVYGYDKECFYFCDPDEGKSCMNYHDFEKILNTPLGKVCIIVRRKTEEEEKSSDKFNEYLKSIAAELKTNNGFFTLSDLQRTLNIGYSRASKIATGLVNADMAEWTDRGKYRLINNVSKSDYRTHHIIGEGSNICQTAHSPNYELLFMIQNGGEHEKMKSLICAEEDINAFIIIPNSDGQFLGTYLTFALECANNMAVNLLLKNGADPNLVDLRLYGCSSPMGCIASTPLSSAADIHDSLICADILMENGGDPDATCNRNGKTARDIINEKLTDETNTSYARKYFEILWKMISLNDEGKLNHETFSKLLEQADELFFIGLS